MSYSAFLQALGWAALNSIWQAGLLWGIIWLVNYLFNLKPQKKYILSAACIITSFILFFFDIIFYLNNSDNLQIDVITNYHIKVSSSWISAILSSASIAYLVLLIIPLYQLFENIVYLKRLKKVGLQKVNIDKRLYIQKMSKLLGIKKEVSLYLSELVHTPITIGFLKPIILLPIASLNQLTLQQAEAVLLHELAHIRRYDYLVNIFLSIASTILYFNPFVKFFVRIADASREESCDQTVLQFGYNGISYASALLQLEKEASQKRIFTLAATGKSPLFQRIEKIAGLSSKNLSVRFSHIAALLTAILFAFFIQVFFTIGHHNKESRPFVFSNFANPYYFIGSEEKKEEKKIYIIKSRDVTTVTVKPRILENNNDQNTLIASESFSSKATPLLSNYIIPVSLNQVDTYLSSDEKKKVQSTIGLVKEVLITYEWKNLKKTIPDGLTENEKNATYKEYLSEVSRINWKNLEQNLKADYNNINWRKLEENLHRKLENSLEDSLGCVYRTETLNIPQKIEENNVKIIISANDELGNKAQINSEECILKQDSLQVSRKKIIKL